MRALLAVIVVVLSVVTPQSASVASEFDTSLLNSIKYARDQANLIGTSIWPGFDKAPFGFLVTLESSEVLLCFRSSVDGFKRLPDEEVTACDLQQRANVFPKNLLAAMPVLNGVSTIVMGTPASTGLTRVDWTITIFHEHFHQYQSEFSHYYSRLNDLDLSAGDTSGMWMLNYPFPYEDEGFVESLTQAGIALHAALMREPDSLQRLVSHYLKARQKLKMSVSPADWRYIELQFWAEGVARWTEIEISEQTSDKDIADSGRALRERSLASLLTLDPAKSERGIVYSYGASEAMLLERCMPDWRNKYPDTMALGSLIKTINPVDCH